MSVRTMSTMANRPGQGNSKAALDTTLGKIAAYIPSEILALYLFMWGVANPSTTNRNAGWWLFSIAAIALLIYVVINHLIDSKEITKANQEIKEPNKKVPMPKKKHTLAVFVLGALAFTAYAMSLPQTPFETITSDANTIGAIAAAIFAVFLPMLGSLWGVSPDTPGKAR